jgi:hypothetical protein
MISWQRYTRIGLLIVFFLLFGTTYALLSCADRGEPTSSVQAGKHPAEVLIIRHGEKANDENDIHLNSRGAARAAAIPSLFVIPPTFPTKPAPLPTPDFLYATKQSKHSNRPVETVTPLSKVLGDVQIHDKHKDADFQGVVDAIFGDDKHAGKVVLICWHHGSIPDLASAVAAKARNADRLKTQVPGKWEGAVFDRVWRFTFDDKNQATFANDPQRLLFGDSKK